MSYSIWDQKPELKILPMPFEMAAGLAEAHQKRSDAGMKDFNDIQDNFLKIKALPIDTPKRDAYVQDIQKQLNDLYTSSKGDYGSMIPKLQELKRKINSDLNYGEIGEINKEYLNHQAQVEAFQKAAAEGKFHGNEAIAKKYLIDNPYQQYTLSGGKQKGDYGYNSIQHGTISELPAVGKDLSQVFQQINSDKYQGTLRPTTNGYLRSDTHEFVSYDDVFKDIMSYAVGNPEYTTLNQMVASNTPQDYKTKIVTTGKDKKPVVSELTGPTAGLYDFYRQTAGAIAGRESFDKYSTDYKKDWQMAMSAQNQLDNPDYIPQTENIEYTPDTNRQDPFGGIKPDSWTPNGNPVITPIQPSVHTSSGTIAPGVGSPREATQAEKQKAINDAQNKQKSIVNRAEVIRSQVPELAHASVKDIYEYAQKAYQNASSSFKGYIIPGLDDDQMAGRMLGNLSGKSLYLVASEENGGSGKVTLDQVAKKLNTTPGDIKDKVLQQAKNGTIKFVPLNASKKPGYLVQVTNNSGETADIIIPGSNELEGTFGNFNAAYEAYRSGKIGEDNKNKIYPEDDGIYTSLSRDQNGEPSWKVGRILNHKDTDEFLKHNNVSKYQATQQGVQFTKDGRLISYDIDQSINERVGQWFNSPYMKPYFTNKKKNPVSFQEEE